jgi:AbiJ N-terminal domain 4
MKEKFSTRHGFEREPEIKVTHEAPYNLRGVVVDIAYEAGMEPHSMRSLVCRLLRVREDPDNWRAYPNVDHEVRGIIDDCEWYEVYNVIEAVYQYLQQAPSSRGYSSDSPPQPDLFAAELNKYFRKNGIGWQLADGEVRFRGDRSFEHAVTQATEVLDETERSTAAKELREALHDLSRRPEPDVTGALQHGLAALECVMRDVCGDPKATLGTLLSRHRGTIPSPLNQAVEKIWGFASEQGRHVREGDEPSIEEAELAVHVAGAVATYLIKKHGG